MKQRFDEFSSLASYAFGSPWSLLLIILSLPAWVVYGLVAGVDDTWLLIGTAIMTIVTYVQVPFIQASTNRQSKALMLKLDEMLKATPGQQSDEAIGAEDLPEEELDGLRERVHTQGGVSTDG